MLRYLPAIVLTLEATYWFATSLALPGEKMFRMNEYMYGIFFGALLADLLVRWWLNVHTAPTRSSHAGPTLVGQANSTGSIARNAPIL
jgi:hypothetical protein